ncbi:Ppx/GppA family phosphatase [Phosphitispora sp. TUW77]|uniref:Ppx/GppA phosphatase family protein n=1 Tax=Phosphitispora sp. TUW77 TaxID=3152361 RepID=UPI003AB2EB99
MRIAIVDIGTNSTRLLIAGYAEEELHVYEREMVTTRLGEGIGKKRHLSMPAIERTIEALLMFHKTITSAGADKIVVAATSAVRDADNRMKFLSEVKRQLGWEVRVLSGLEEAELSYMGAVSGFGLEYGDSAVVDIGGGSTEFIWTQNGKLNCNSKQVGAVRMTDIEISQTEIAELLAEVLCNIRGTGVKHFIGVGGTITTAAAIDQQLVVYDPKLIHGYSLKEGRIADILFYLERISSNQRKQVPGLQPERADIIVSGLRILLAVVRGLDTNEITVSETDIMHGLALSVARSAN